MPSLTAEMLWLADIARRRSFANWLFMVTNGLMIHAGVCAYCEQGYLGFWICDDQKSCILFCDECQTAFLSPQDVAADIPILARSGEIQELDVSYVGGRDALREEVASFGWAMFIKGKYPYYKNKSGYRISAEKAEVEQRKRDRK